MAETQSVQTLTRTDAELSGRLSSAAGQGAQFALLLAMLEQNVLHRPNYAKSEDTLVAADKDFPERLNNYPPVSLSATSTHFACADVANRLFRDGESRNAQLWLAMHPDPLSMYNDPSRIDDEVVQNCDLPTQTYLQIPRPSDIPVDATLMLDVIEQARPS